MKYHFDQYIYAYKKNTLKIWLIIKKNTEAGLIFSGICRNQAQLVDLNSLIVKENNEIFLIELNVLVNLWSHLWQKNPLEWEEWITVP